MPQDACRGEPKAAGIESAAAGPNGTRASQRQLARSSYQKLLQRLVQDLSQQLPKDDRSEESFAWTRYTWTRHLAKALDIHFPKTFETPNHIEGRQQAGKESREGSMRYLLSTRLWTERGEESLWLVYLRGAGAAVHYRDPAALRSKITLSRVRHPRTDLESLRGDVLRALVALARKGGDKEDGEEGATRNFRAGGAHQEKPVSRSGTA